MLLWDLVVYTSVSISSVDPPHRRTVLGGALRARSLSTFRQCGETCGSDPAEPGVENEWGPGDSAATRGRWLRDAEPIPSHVEGPGEKV